MMNGQPVYLQSAGGNQGPYYVMPNSMPQMEQRPQQYPTQLQPQQLFVVPSPSAPSSTLSEPIQAPQTADATLAEKH